MNQVATTENQEAAAPQKPFEKFRDNLMAQKGKMQNVLPAHISFEKFHSVVMTACMANPMLLQAERSSLLLSCVKSATDGLLPDNREAALVIFNAKLGYKDDAGRDVYGPKVQYMPMYAGLLKKARQSKEISSIATHVVFQKDRFEYKLGDEEKIIHEPYMGTEDRGPVIAAYCIAQLKDGTVHREVMTRGDIEKVRKTSKSGDKNGQPSGIWAQWYDEMARKTVFRRASKWLPQSIDKEGNEIRIFDNDETLEAIEGIAEGETYTIEGDDAPAQLEEIKEAQPDLKQAIDEKKAEAEAAQPENAKAPDDGKKAAAKKADPEKPEEEAAKPSLFDLEQEIRKAIKEAGSLAEAKHLVENSYADDLARIKKEASGSYATLSTWIDAQLKGMEGK